jgi:GTP cyclohydrolase I
MEDLQSLPDARRIGLERVGISRLAMPIKVLEKAGTYQAVVAQVNAYVELPSTIRGTHLSRFVELITSWADGSVSSETLCGLLGSICSRAHSSTAEIELRFKYFLRKRAPVSGLVAPLDYDVVFHGRLDGSDFGFTLGVGVPISTVCPCSKAISDYGAHNQRATVAVRIHYKPGAFVWIEDLVALVEDQGSCELFPVLKRVDEKLVTERGYENPKFVEDVVRDVALALRELPGVERFSIECESSESIHNHNAFAAYQEEAVQSAPKVSATITLPVLKGEYV